MRKELMLILLFMIVLSEGCSTVSFNLDLDPYNFEISPTGVMVTDFWAEKGFKLPEKAKNIQIDEVTFNFTITNEIGYDVRMTLVWSLEGTASEGETVIYTQTPSYITSANENTVFVYVMKDVFIPSGGITNIIVTISSNKFLSDLTESNMHWISLKNNILGTFSGFTSNSKQSGSVTISIKGRTKIGL